MNSVKSVIFGLRYDDDGVLLFSVSVVELAMTFVPLSKTAETLGVTLTIITQSKGPSTKYVTLQREGSKKV